MVPLYFSKEVVLVVMAHKIIVILTVTATCVRVLSLFRAHLSFKGFEVKILAMRKEASSHNSL